MTPKASTNMDRIKNPDIIAMVTTGSALFSDIVARAATDESLLAQLPPWAVLLMLFLAASARYRLGQRAEPSEPGATDEADITTSDDAGDGDDGRPN